MCDLVMITTSVSAIAVFTGALTPSILFALPNESVSFTDVVDIIRMLLGIAFVCFSSGGFY
jgi:hypothetical protein